MPEPIVKKWHMPGLGEIHDADHTHIIYCTTDYGEFDVAFKVDNELAQRLCDLLNASELNSHSG